MKRFTLIVSLVTLLAAITAAQSQITADPNAKPLREIWRIEGNILGGDRVGDAAGGLGDIFGTGFGAWAVYYGTAAQWRIFAGGAHGLSTTPVHIFQPYGSVPAYPVVGNFYGTGHKVIGLSSGSEDTVSPGHEVFYYQLHLFRTDSNRLDTVPSAILDARKMAPKTQIYPHDILAADLDGDGADELILLTPGVVRGNTLSDYPEIWIYKGGAKFQVDSPTVILRDPEIDRDNVRIATGDFDGDGHIDIAQIGLYPGRSKLYFYWGNSSLAMMADPINRRVVELNADSPSGDGGITVLDCDGDKVMDISLDRSFTGKQGMYLFRSRSGKNARTRSYRMDEADWTSEYTDAARGGYLNDSRRRYDMLVLYAFAAQPNDVSHVRLLSGGPDGPDHMYDALYDGALIGKGAPLRDVDGDGWDDFLGYNSGYGIEAGEATIFAGGPYIPGVQDAGVEAITGEGHASAISLWPIPARDELHIAWRGDLQSMPSRFIVHDLLGREVASGSVESWRGSALWNCAEVPAGMYVLSILDDRGERITTVRLLKQ